MQKLVSIGHLKCNKGSTEVTKVMNWPLALTDLFTHNDNRPVVWLQFMTSVVHVVHAPEGKLYQLCNGLVLIPHLNFSQLSIY